MAWYFFEQKEVIFFPELKEYGNQTENSLLKSYGRSKGYDEYNKANVTPMGNLAQCMVKLQSWGKHLTNSLVFSTFLRGEIRLSNDKITDTRDERITRTIKGKMIIKNNFITTCFITDPHKHFTKMNTRPSHLEKHNYNITIFSSFLLLPPRRSGYHYLQG